MVFKKHGCYLRDNLNLACYLRNVDINRKGKSTLAVTQRMRSMEKASYFISLKSSRDKTNESLETTILTGLHSEKIMIVLSATLPSHSVPQHSHSHEQIGMVYSGKGDLRIGDEEKNVKKGDFYCIPANVQHGDTCIGVEPFAMLDIFYPMRKDFIQKQSEQTTV